MAIVTVVFRAWPCYKEMTTSSGFAKAMTRDESVRSGGGCFVVDHLQLRRLSSVDSANANQGKSS